MARECVFLWKREKRHTCCSSRGHGPNRYVNFKSATACSVLPRAHRLVSKEEEREESHLARYKMRSLPHSLINWPRAPRLGPHAPFALPLPPRTPEPGAPWPPRGPFGPLPPSSPLHILFTSSASFRMPIGPFKSTSWRHRTELPTYIREERVSLFSSFLSSPLSYFLHRSIPFLAVLFPFVDPLFSLVSSLPYALHLVFFPRLPVLLPMSVFYRSLLLCPSLSLPFFGRSSRLAGSLGALPRHPCPSTWLIRSLSRCLVYLFLTPASRSPCSRTLFWLLLRVRDLSTRRLVYSPFVSSVL